MTTNVQFDEQFPGLRKEMVPCLDEDEYTMVQVSKQTMMKTCLDRQRVREVIEGIQSVYEDNPDFCPFNTIKERLGL